MAYLIENNVIAKCVMGDCDQPAEWRYVHEHISRPDKLFCQGHADEVQRSMPSVRKVLTT